MKMGAALFWGLLLILIGIGIVIKVVFNINIPVVKFIIAFFFIFIGIKLLIGNFNVWDKNGDNNTTIFSESKIYEVNDKYKEYNVVFGGSVIDLRNLDLSEDSKQLKVNTIFGNTVLKVNEKTPLRIKTEAVFSTAKLPNGSTATFGSDWYESETFNKDSNHVFIQADVVFGNFEVRTY